VQVSVPEGQRRWVGCGGAPVELKNRRAIYQPEASGNFDE
jgi:hypothetical protein